MTVIKKDLSHLPKVGRREYVPEHRPERAPDFDPDIAPILAQAWYDAYGHEQDRHLEVAIPAAGPLRASSAMNCSRRIAYDAAGLPATDPPTIAGIWVFWLGALIHKLFQAQYKVLWPDAIVEADVDLRPIGMDGSAHADLLVPDGVEDQEGNWYPPGVDVPQEGEWVTVWRPVELKTIGGYAFKKATTTFQGGPEGPKEGAVVQMALVAASLVEQGYRIRRGTVVNLSKENLSPNMAESLGLAGEVNKFSAQWTFPIEDLQQQAREEAKRQQGILNKLRVHDDPKAVRRMGRDDDETWVEIINPAKSQARKGDRLISLWHGSYCDYCSQQSRCINDLAIEQGAS